MFNIIHRKFLYHSFRINEQIKLKKVQINYIIIFLDIFHIYNQ